ncbi:DUF1127 domain-containing protein [Maritimibacter alkaliphilus]|uniref:DUF1127 domain-containing protein n=1 Tax=Rhodobacterales TaxID=204455 RepID=UPI001C97BE08|nr:DUF1127 domain-containing protein [Maritimibacter alkaliphilus]
MGAFYIAAPKTDSAALYGRMGRAISTLLAAISDWNDARVTRNALSKLSDRELDDIGLTRGDIDRVSVFR